MERFVNRREAGQFLSQILEPTFKGQSQTVVIGLARGGVIIAAEVATELNLPLDVLVIRKVGLPNQPELAVGAVDPDKRLSWNRSLLKKHSLTPHELNSQVEKEYQELQRRHALYHQNYPVLDLNHKKVILTDDGIATGATTRAAVNYSKRHGAAEVIIAAPVITQEARSSFTKKGLKVFGYIPPTFNAVGQFYQFFFDITDSEVISALKSAPLHNP